MAILHYFPAFCSLSSRELIIFHSPIFLPYAQSNYIKKWHCGRICASLSEKPRRVNRKVKSNAELCSDIREFLSSVGLPEDHVPSTKELSQHGRPDLANIVRRRGYKYIKQLLETSITKDIDTGQNENLRMLNGLKSFAAGKGQNEKLRVLENEPLSNEPIQEGDFCDHVEKDEQLNLDDQISCGSEAHTLSLQEKVANFVQHGELDDVEDSFFGTSYQIHSDDVESTIDTEGTLEPELTCINQEQKDPVLYSSTGAETLNGSAFSSVKEVEDPVISSSLSRNSFTSNEEKTRVNHDRDSDSEKMENGAEVKHLKFLLHQKELELTQLKEQIEKEKLALLALQTKAETEISKAQKLVSQKETELHIAEESLMGLKEVEIQYTGEGETVEVAGSFNGWNHKINMDLLQSSIIMDNSGSRTPRVWRAVLWLYPGVYEIKFVIDGHWRTDPQMETVTRNNVHNNILRVDR